MGGATVLVGVLLVGKMAALLRESNEVREDHTAKADMVERLNGVGHDVLGMVVVDTLSNSVLDVAPVSYTHLTLPTKRIV